jgi:predicted secreted protein
MNEKETVAKARKLIQKAEYAKLMQKIQQHLNIIYNDDDPINNQLRFMGVTKGSSL